MTPARRWLARATLRLARRLAGPADPRALAGDPGAPDLRAGLARLRAHGATIRHAVDGGACRGDWTRAFLDAFPGATVLMVEPLARHRAALEALVRARGGAVRYLAALLGPHEAAAVPFTVLDDPLGSGSSVLPEHSDVPRHVESLPMLTLDGVIALAGTPPPDLIKLDVQGYELAVLEGATQALAGAAVVVLEVSTWPYNAGAPLLADVVARMRAHGFVAHDVLGLMRRPDGVLLQLDLLFLRADSPLRADPMTRYGAAGPAPDMPPP